VLRLVTERQKAATGKEPDKEESMPAARDYSAASESLLLALLALFLLVSPFAIWWMRLTPPWYFSYLIWLGLLCLIAVLGRRLARYDL
jgi:hypothetical protein